MANIHILAVSFLRFGELKVFVQSIINQTFDNWTLCVIHDGHNEEFIDIMKSYSNSAPGKITYCCTEIRYCDYGHTLRDIGIQRASGDYIIVTNADNYYIPKAIEFLTQVVSNSNPDVVIFDMIHSHSCPGGRPQPQYSYFQTNLKRDSIDIGAALVNLELAKKVGFRDKTHSGDATFFEDISAYLASKNLVLNYVKIHQVLLVHN